MKSSPSLLMRLMWLRPGTARHFVIMACRSRGCEGLSNVTEYGLVLKDQDGDRLMNIINAIGGSSCTICRRTGTKAVAIDAIGSIARLAKPGSNQFCGETSRNWIPV